MVVERYSLLEELLLEVLTRHLLAVEYRHLGQRNLTLRRLPLDGLEHIVRLCRGAAAFNHGDRIPLLVHRDGLLLLAAQALVDQ